MKKIVLTICANLINATIFAQTMVPFTSRVESEISSSNPLRDIEILASPVRSVVDRTTYTELTYHIDGATIENRESEEYSRIRIKSFSTTNVEGKPMLPYRSELIVVPSFEGLSLSVSDAKSIEYAGYEIEPAQPTSRGYVELASQVVRNEKAYSTDSYYPRDVVRLVDTLTWRGVKLARVQICPVQYNPVRHTLRCYSDVSFRLNHVATTVAESDKAPADDVLAAIVANPSALVRRPEVVTATQSASYAQPVKMIVVTTNALSSSLSDYFRIVERNSKRQLV